MKTGRRQRLLIVTYVYPPFVAVGVYRILKFCKYLREFDIDPVILTPTNPTTMMRDDNSIKLVPGDIPIYRSWNYEPFRWKGPVASEKNDTPDATKKADPGSGAKPETGFLTSIKKGIRQNLTVPDGIYFWSWTGLREGIRAVDVENVDLVLSSSPPQSVHLLASRIARLTGRPHIVDFRDLWTQNTSYEERNLPGYLKRRDRGYEKRILARAAAVTVNTDTFKQQLLEKNRFLAEDKVEVVTNGVDPDDFLPHLGEFPPNGRFTMLYTGSLYGKHRNPDFFFAAVREWLNSRPELSSKIKIVFIGNWAPEHSDLLVRHNLGDIVERCGWRPQEEALRATFGADLLLLFQGFDPALAAAIPRKLYEYMITNKLILAFAPPGEIPGLIEKYDCGLSLAQPTAEPILAFLNRAYDKWQARIDSGKISSPGLRPLPELETSAQVKKLAELCRRVVLS